MALDIKIDSKWYNLYSKLVSLTIENVFLALWIFVSFSIWWSWSENSGIDVLKIDFEQNGDDLLEGAVETINAEGC